MFLAILDGALPAGALEDPVAALAAVPVAQAEFADLPSLEQATRVALRLDMYRDGSGSTQPIANDYVAFNRVTVAVAATSASAESVTEAEIRASDSPLVRKAVAISPSAVSIRIGVRTPRERE